MSAFLLLFLTVSCADETPPQPKMPTRLSIDAATTMIAHHIRKEKPKANLGPDFAVIDLTDDSVWNQLKVQIVKVKERAVEQGEAFILYGEKVYPIGEAFGGDGITSVLVADLAGDKRPLLIYAFAWGSGRHRSQIGVFDLHAKEPKEYRLSPTNFAMDDYVLRSSENGHVEVLMGKTPIGHVTAARNDGVLDTTIKIVETLPEEVRRQLVKQSETLNNLRCSSETSH